MSFIRPRRQHLLDKAVRFRGELVAFLGLATVWGLLLNLLASALWQFGGNDLVSCLIKILPDWSHWPLAALGILLFAWIGMQLLANALSSSLEELRRFTIVVPAFATEQAVGLLAIDRYPCSKLLVGFFNNLPAANTLMDTYRAYRSDDKTMGRPFQGALYDAIAVSLINAILSSLRNANDFYLGNNGLYHGVEYFASLDTTEPQIHLLEPRVSAETIRPISLPPNCTVAVVPDKPDRHGKSIPKIVVKFPRGRVEIRFHSQYSLMSHRYHGRSLKVLQQQIHPPTSNYEVCGNTPSLWPMEFICLVRVHFQSKQFPWKLLNDDIEEYASWVDDLLHYVEEKWSWESYIEINSLGDSAS